MGFKINYNDHVDHQEHVTRVTPALSLKIKVHVKKVSMRVILCSVLRILIKQGMCFMIAAFL